MGHNSEVPILIHENDAFRLSRNMQNAELCASEILDHG